MSDPIQTVDEAAQESAPVISAESAPERIGRYRVKRLLGQGGFGLVYLAHDDQLQRLVAIKVPHRHRVSTPEDAEAYLAEARTVANLDHPNIVPVHDVGSTEDCPFFIVSKYIEGSTLTQRIQEDPPSVNESVELVATVAETLHFAHRKGLFHRDIKPGNILLDTSGKPYVADFGLALKEENIGRGPKYAGTPAYMSPEQARGEGHRVDGRSDIFGLGVVLYEILTGRRPFRAECLEELLDEITSHEPRPPRQIDDAIPRELDRICLKALSKRASERYSAAKDMADDLRHFLASASQDEKLVLTGPARTEAEQTTPVPSPTTPPRSDSQPVKIVPKGLRSFDEADADFFLELLPGARDRDGLPDSIRFWKTRVEKKEADSTFAVGLIYGPSGCGKSSLVKAGLLPRLAKTVTAVYIEATGEETEARLLKGLRRQLPDLPANLNLIDSLAALRRGGYLEPGQKVLLVLDQFEQYLHTRRNEENTELVEALRQCDGGRLQGIVMVRDDFWLAVSRFMQELEVRVLEGENSRLVDLFDARHARKVLTAFGRAFGALPEKELAKDQNAFLDQAVAGLAEDGKIISVRLALFAEMVKGKPWTPATLKAVGGTEGVGATFLEETFTASTAPPQHRLHQKAAQAILKSLLPESGTDIKGHMRSQQELLNASGYGNRPKEFDDLLRILDSEIRLITPMDPEGKDHADASTLKSAEKYYQLTHDYLVNSLRDWLTRKQKETRRGRAELLLADRAAVWNARPENRQLPSLLQWFNVRWWTSKKTWTPPQRKMMAKAGQYHALRGAAVAVLLALAALTGLTIRDQVEKRRKATYADALVQSLLNANIAQVPAIVREMASYRQWTDPLLREENDKAAGNSSEKLHTSLALLPVDATQVNYLYDRLLDAEPPEVPVIRDALAPYKKELVDRLWRVVETPEKGKEQQRLRAACALASYDVPDSGQGTARWQRVSATIVAELLAAVQKNPSNYATLLDQLRPVRANLLVPLTKVYRSKEKPEAERSFVTTILADYATDKPDVLANLLMDADEKQFGVIYPKLMQHGERAAALLTSEIRKEVSTSLEWSVRFYKWDKAGEQKPPADWEAVVKSPILDELRMPHLHLGKEYLLPKPPTPRVPQEYFAVVATTEVTLGGGEYTLTATADGGIRIWLDNERIVDDWRHHAAHTTSAAIVNKAGRHRIKVEFFQADGSYVLDVALDAEREQLAKRQANAAVALLKMNQTDEVWPLLKHSPDPRVRSYLIHRLSPLGADPQAILKRLDEEPDITIRRALLLSLGEYSEKELPDNSRQGLMPKLQAFYRSEPDPGLHAATEWLLRSWKQEAWLKQVNDEWAREKVKGEGWWVEGKNPDDAGTPHPSPSTLHPSPHWYVNGQGQTMVVFPGPVEFVMGSPLTEKDRRSNERQHKQRIGRTFALAAAPVTKEQFLRFQPTFSHSEFGRYPLPTCPIGGVTWYEAAAYCNWLSQQEGIPEDQWCYEIPDEPGNIMTWRFKNMKLKASYLNLTGYRLPTEAEWEYACRAGATTSRYYGETAELLPQYGWYFGNSPEQTQSVGSKKPNDWGLFDMHGNVWSSCQERYKPYATVKQARPIDDIEDSLSIISTDSRVLRGGSFGINAVNVRSACRSNNAPALRNDVIGFRPARTLPPDSFTALPLPPKAEEK